MLRDAQTHAAPYLHVLPQQTLGSTRVDVVQVTADRNQTTYYIDAHNYRLWGVDQSDLSPGGQALPQVTVRVLRRTPVRLTAVPASTFALHTPAAVHIHDLRTTARAIDVSQAVGQPGIPAPLLSRDVAGLRLQDVERSRRQGVTTTSYQYGAYMDDPVRFRMLRIAALTWPSATSAAKVRPALGTPITLTILRQPVHATYRMNAFQTGDVQFLDYRQGATWVWLTGFHLSKTDFFAALAALVDGKTHPHVVAHVQHELDRAVAARGQS